MIYLKCFYIFFIANVQREIFKIFANLRTVRRKKRLYDYKSRKGDEGR